MGVDALIIEGNEAGGHIGPVSTGVLAEQILPHTKEVPVFVAGGIGSGKLMAHYLMLGGSGVQLGTRFSVAYRCVVGILADLVVLCGCCGSDFEIPKKDKG